MYPYKDQREVKIMTELGTKFGSFGTSKQCIIFVSSRCGDYGCKSLLVCMKIDQQRRKCMIKLGL